MNQPQILRKFEYSIPLSSYSLTGYKSKGSKVYHDHFSLLNLVIDFEEGEMLLEGDWQYMLYANPHRTVSTTASHRGNVVIKAAISADMPLSLSDADTGGFVFPVEGNIKDEFGISACTGMLVFENTSIGQGLQLNRSYISIYLYDWQHEGSEIMFRLPVYVASGDITCN